MFGRGPLRKDLDLGLTVGKTYGVPTVRPRSLTRDIVQTLIGHGYTDQDVATLLLLQAKASGIELQPENVEIGDGLSAEKS
jgi:3-hydroxyisobutyrate dehydrogenase